jgi:hypothetical protein
MEDIGNSSSLDELQSKLKQKFPELSDTDLQIKQTSKKDFLQMVGYKLRKTKQEMSHIISLL